MHARAYRIAGGWRRERRVELARVQRRNLQRRHGHGRRVGVGRSGRR